MLAHRSVFHMWTLYSVMAHPLVLGRGSCPLTPTRDAGLPQVWWLGTNDPVLLTQLSRSSPCPLPLSGIFTQGFTAFFISRYLFHVSSYCQLSSMPHVLSQTRHPGGVSPPGPTPWGCHLQTCCLWVRLPCWGASAVWAIGGRVRAKGSVSASPTPGPLPWEDYRHCCSLQSKNSHFFKFFLMSGYPGRKVFVSPLTHHDARLFPLAVSKHGLRRPAFK